MCAPLLTGRDFFGLVRIAVEESLDFFPFDRRLASFIELTEHPMMCFLDHRTVFVEVLLKALACNENEAGDP